jgi:hypothetical protein
MADGMSNRTLPDPPRGVSPSDGAAEVSEESLTIHKDRVRKGCHVLDDRMESELIIKS